MGVISVDQILNEIKNTLRKITPCPWKWDIEEVQSDGEIIVQGLAHWNGKNGSAVLDVMKNKYNTSVINGWNSNDLKLIENAPIWLGYLIDIIRKQQDEINQFKLDK